MVGLQLLDVSKLKGTNSNNHQLLDQIDLVELGKVDLGKALVGRQLELVVGELVVGMLVVVLAGRQARYLERFEAQFLELALQLGQLELR